MISQRLQNVLSAITEAQKGRCRHHVELVAQFLPVLRPIPHPCGYGRGRLERMVGR